MKEIAFSRFTAFVISAAALSGDLLLLRETVSREHAGWLHGIWTDGMFFSDLSSLLVAILFAFVGTKMLQTRRPWWLGLALLCVLLTGLGAQGWRGFARPLTGNTLVHTWVPLSVALWCLAFAAKGRLRWTYLPGWTLVPIAYLIYALGRGTVTEVYPYPWLNLDKVGVEGVGLNAAIQLVTFVVLAAILVALDQVWNRLTKKIRVTTGAKV